MSRRSSPTVAWIAGLSALACSPELEEPAEVVRPVRALEVRSSVPVRERAFSGVTHASIESALSFKVGGTVEDVLVEVGDAVRAEQVIAHVDSTDAELQLEQAKAALNQARAEARKAENDFERVRTLYENGNTSKQSYDQARAQKEATEQSVRNYEKQVELVERNLSYTELRSPAEGSIATVDVEAGENVAAGQRIVQLVAGNILEVHLGIPEIVISDVVRGMPVEVDFVAAPDQHFEGRVTEVGIATGPTSNYPVIVALEGSWARLRPGMAADVHFRFEGEGNDRVFVVPSTAVHEDTSGRHLFVVEDNGAGRGVVRRRDVRVGGLTSAGLEVLDGLAEGDLVVTAGMSRIEDGLAVKVDANWIVRP